jgi:hypothetical protein
MEAPDPPEAFASEGQTCQPVRLSPQWEGTPTRRWLSPIAGGHPGPSESFRSVRAESRVLKGSKPLENGTTPSGRRTFALRPEGKSLSCGKPKLPGRRGHPRTTERDEPPQGRDAPPHRKGLRPSSGGWRTHPAPPAGALVPFAAGFSRLAPCGAAAIDPRGGREARPSSERGLGRSHSPSPRSGVLNTPR